MQTAWKIKEIILNATILVTLLFLLGTPARANVIATASPTTVSFGSQAVGTISAPSTVTVTNTGKHSVNIVGASVSSAQFLYSGPTLPITLNQGQSLTASVQFAPAAVQTYAGTLVFTRDNGPTITVTLSGNGVQTTVMPQAPSITSQPGSQTVAAGTTATFTVAVTGTTPMTYQWNKNGTAISGATSSSYTTPATTTSDNNAQFTVTVSNSAGNATSNAATLTVNAAAVAPSITTQPSSQTVSAGQTATFSVAATGTSPMMYQWNKNGTAVSGATSSSYTTPAETTSDNNAQFTVMVANNAGSATSTAANLTVNAAAVAPSITTQPSSLTVIAGQTATFSVAATGTSPMTYQWKKNGTAVSGATSSSYTTPATTTSDNNALFTVTVTNSAGSATSNAATLTVNAAAVAPSITTQPSSQTVIAGQTATFSVAATGTSPMTYQWKKNGTAVSGATSSSYTTPATTTSDNNALFAVTVTNSAGIATSNSATLTVTAATLVLNGSSTALNFGNVNVSSSSSQNVTMTNAGTSNVTISGVSISGAGFNASGVSTGLILSPGQTATLTVMFSPSATGSVTGNVAVASNASNSPDNVSLSGSGVSVVSHSVALTWTASTSTVTGYNTYSGTTSGGPYMKLTTVSNATTGYTDSTVQSGKTYYYVVTAVDSSNTESVYSGQIIAVIP